MKLMQLNIWFGRLDQAALNLIKQESPDILCLQEASSIKGKVGGVFLTIEEIVQHTDLKHVFMSPMFHFRYMHRTMKFGNAILSKQDFVNTETIFTNKEVNLDFDFDIHDYNIRNLQHAALKVSGKALHVLNHHGHHVPNHKNGDANTMRQMKQIAEYIKTLDGPVVLTGDFNLAPSSESLDVINDVLKNLSVENKLTTTRTALTHKTEVCDYIFVNKQVKTKSFSASSEVVSDHKALILEFQL